MSLVAAPPASPYKGLAAFEDTELDALFFFGREREREVLVANLLAARLTVLYGESGVGKSSLLSAAVVRDLRAAAAGATVVLHDTWSGSLAGVLDSVRGAAEAYLILDQFEEYFLYHADDEGSGSLLQDLPALLSDSPVNVLIALREDALARLDAFKARLPSVFGNRVRLEHLDREAAGRAILGPLERWNELSPEDHVRCESELVEAVLDECAVDPERSPRQRIEAPYLQLVLERIWTTEHAAGSRLLRLETLHELGGARAIVRDHLLGALSRLPPEEQDVAASMFEHLVTPSGTKIAHRAPDLAEYARVPEDSLRRVLATLTHDRIVHSIDGSDRYEIFHDVLADPISAWRLQRRLELERAAAKRRQRRLAAVAVAALVALGIVAGLAIWAFSERSHARSQARHARAREFEETALQQLPTDPQRSVGVALAAARLEPGLAAETVLRQSLIEDRLRLTVHVRGPVAAVAMSPGGALFAAAAPHGRVLLVDAVTGLVRRRFSAPGGAAELAFSSDGDELLATDRTGEGIAWDVSDGRVVSPYRRFLVGLGPDGRLDTFPRRGLLSRIAPHIERLRLSSTFAAAAVRMSDGHVRTWIFDKHGRRLHLLPEIGIQDLAFSPDGRVLAAGSADGTTTLWNPRSGRRLRVLEDGGKGVIAVAFSPDGKLLATGGQDSAVRIWTLSTGVRLFLLIAHTNPVTAVAWSPDGRILASASLDRTIRLWRVANIIAAGSVAAALVGHGDGVQALAYSADGTRLVTGGDDGTARVWDARPDQELRLLGRAGGAVVSARFAGDSVVAASADGTVRLWDGRSGRLLHVLRNGTGRPLTALAVTQDGARVAAGGDDGTTVVWDGRDGRRLDVVGGAHPVLAVALSRDGRAVASGDSVGVVRTWDAATGRLRWVHPQGSPVADLAFSPRGDQLASASLYGVVIRSTQSGRVLHRLPVRSGVARLVYSRDGRLVATGDRDGTVRVWFAASGSPYRVFRGHRATVTDLVFSADAKLLASSSADADGRVWNLVTGTHVHVLRAHFGRVAAIAFSPDSRWLVTAGPISAGLWPTATGQLLLYLRGPSDLLTDVEFSPDGRTILAASRDGTVRTYRCEVCGNLTALEDLARQRLARAR